MYPQSNVPMGGTGGWKSRIGDWIGKVIPVVGSVIGGILDKQSQDATNKANAQNVDKQIEFQREQAATQYQRGVADLTAAGLNPALAYKQGGADAQGGASAEYHAVSHGQRLQQAVDAYNQFANGTAQRELIRQQAASTSADARLKTLQGSALQPQAFLGTNKQYLDDYQTTEVAKRRGERFTAEHTPELYGITTAATRQGTATAAAQAELMRTQSTLNEQEFQNAWFRKNIAPYLNSTAKAMDVIGGTARTAKGVTGLSPKWRFY